MHPVDSWLLKEQKTRPWFAQEIGVSRATLSRMIAGKQWPSRGTCENIVRLTHGEVTADAFLAAPDADEASTKPQAAA